MSAGAVAEMAAIRKTSKYQELAAQYSFQPVALESLGSMDSDTRDFWLISGGGSQQPPVMMERFLFCFSVFLFFFFISIRFSYLIALSWATDWSFSLSNVCISA